jgi:hypothetical protein
MYPALLEQLGEQEQLVAHLIQNQFKIDQVEALVSLFPYLSITLTQQTRIQTFFTVKMGSI